MKKINFFILFSSILICQTAGIIGAIATQPAISVWYNNLKKPEFAPPNWIFGPVWIILYVLMGISLYLILKKWNKSKTARQAATLFLIHLIFNALWSTIFFAMQKPLYAFIDIVILIFLVVLIIAKFDKINKIAAYLLFPYLIWITFAAILNYSIFLLNI